MSHMVSLLETPELENLARPKVRKFEVSERFPGLDNDT